MANPLLVARGDRDVVILPQMANRHGMIAGATGTGKTVSLMVLAEQFSSIGVPVFLADVKCDLAGLSQPGGGNAKVDERIASLNLSDFTFRSNPVVFWDVFGEQGHPARATISEMGPTLLARLLDLNDTQSDVLSVVFKVADQNGLLLLDLKDLQSMLRYVGENTSDFETQYGRMSTASIGAIQRALVSFEAQGGAILFGEPALDLHDLLQTDAGRGVINILAADRLMRSPKVYATFLLWLLSELFESLPEVGDLDKPKLVFFFDEAHLLFSDAPSTLLDKIEQVVRLIRSKGVGVYFISQNPLDIPDIVLGQLGNRIQHALRAFTPRDQKAVKAAADTFRINPEIDVQTAITELEVGEALASMLDEKGRPEMVERAYVLPPRSSIGPITLEAREAVIKESVLYGHYEQGVDRNSAYEMLMVRSAQEDQSELRAAAQAEADREEQQRQKEAAQASRRESPLDAFLKSAARAVGGQFGREVMRGVLGSILGGKRRRR
jgi:DNA helicase HerA-like ATPase